MFGEGDDKALGVSLLLFSRFEDAGMSIDRSLDDEMEENEAMLECDDGDAGCCGKRDLKWLSSSWKVEFMLELGR